jgi:uncharacterized membrane protein YcaP (DUF421 family)
MDWKELFAFSVSPLEMVVRGTVMYLFLFTVFRFLMRRDIGALNVADILLLVIVADAAQNALAGEAKSIGDGLVLVSTILAWNALLDWIGYRWRRADRVLEGQQLVLVRNGEIEYDTLDKERMTERELMAKLREHGVAKLAEVKRAYLESGGNVTVIKRDP